MHHLAHQLNQSLGNVGTTVTYAPTIEVNSMDQVASLRDLATAMDAGQVDLLVILGSNPVFTAPADLKFQERLAKVALTVSHSLYPDETSRYCQWNLPEAHALESWGDARAYDGTVTVMQPLIAPLYLGRTTQEVLGAFHRRADRQVRPRSGEGLLDARAGRQGRQLHDHRRDRPAVQERGQLLEARAARWVDSGDGGGSRPRPRPAAAAPAAPTPASSRTWPRRPRPRSADSGRALEIIFRPDPTIWDGRFANNGWLQELPKPLTKITWDPTAWVSPQLAQQQGLRDGDVIELKYRGNTAKLPVTIVPGHPDGAVTAFFGYGRQLTGRVGTSADALAKDFNVYRLRTSDALWFGGGLEIAKTGDRFVIARTQEHHLMEGRAPVRVATAEEYTKDPEVIHHQGHKIPKTLTMIPEWEYKGHKWGMSIDLTSCTGCGVCTVACVAENNIPVVGKDQVSRGREMHWIRVDHYFSGDRRESRDLPSAGAVHAVRERARASSSARSAPRRTALKV